MPETATEMLIDSPVILSLNADLNDSNEPHVTWSIGYAPEPDADGSRFVIAHLHVAGAGHTIDVDVAGDLRGDESGTLGEVKDAQAFEARLVEVSSLNALYFMARTAALSLAGMLEGAADLPSVPPARTITQLVRASAEEA